MAFSLPTQGMLRIRSAYPATVRRFLAAALAIGALLASLTHAHAQEEPPSVPSEQAPAKPPVKTKVTLGKPRMVKSGPLPKGTEAALMQVGPALEDCYKVSVLADQDSDASIELRLELVGPGRVASANVNASVEASSTLRACVRDAFAGVAAGGVGPAPVEVLMTIGFASDVDPSTDDLLPASSCPATCDGEMDDDLKMALRQRAAKAAACFKRAAAAGEAPTLKSGTIDIDVKVASDGSICGVATHNDTFNRPSLTSCIVETMSATLATKPVGCVEVTVPMVFKGT